MRPSHIMTQSEIIRNNLNQSDWEITKDKCDSTRAHRRHLAANGKHENKRKIYCTNVHLRIIEILITLMYKLSAVTAAVTAFCRFGLPRCAGLFCPFLVPCCCLLCGVVRGAACCVLLCRVLLCSAGGVMLRCVSSCGCALLRALPCSVALCCVVVHCAVRWGAASWCSVLCCPAVCCCGLLCAVWCQLALCGWLGAVLLCCLLLCAVLRLWAWCLVALCCAVLVVACCFVVVALLCAVTCLLVLCWAVSRRVMLCGAVLLCTALWGWHCAALSCGLWCPFLLWRALGCCAVPRVLSALLRAVLCCCVLCCAWGCGVLVRCAVLFALCLAVCSGSVFLCGVLCLLVLWCSALRFVVLCGVVLLRTVLFVWCCAVFARAVLVLLRAVPCPRVLCRAVGCCVVWCDALLCCPVLFALRCVCFAVVLWCVLFLLLSLVLLVPCGVTSVHFQNQKKLFPIFKNRKNCFPLVCPVYPVLPACNNTTH